MSGRDRARRRRPAPPHAGPLGHGDLATSLLYIFPLYLAYEIGVLFSSTVNGVDFVTRAVFEAVGRDRERYLLLHLLLAAAFLGYVLYARRRRDVRARPAALMVAESAIYALTLGSFILFVMRNLFGFGPALDVFGPVLGDLDRLALGETGQAVVSSLGAGVHEELVFRLGLMAGGAALLQWAGARHLAAIAVAMVASSLLFSAAHHVGPMGDELRAGLFTYRALAGVVFAAIFYYRSLAHAVYTHFLYDVYVMVIQAQT